MAAYEAELNRITSAEMILQTVAALLNIGGRRLGLSASAQDDPAGAALSERDLEQVRDAIDGVRALMPIVERRAPGDLRPLRDALSTLQMAYAREAQTSGSSSTASSPEQAPRPGTESRKPGSTPGDEKPPAAEPQTDSRAQPRRPGPAEASGRLWVPGR